MRTLRDYKKVLNEVINLQIPFRVEIIDYVVYEETYPILAIKHISKVAKQNIVITAGIHGEEYYTVHILLKWLQQVDTEVFKDFNFYIFPIVNPFGYSKGCRQNGARQDINNANNYRKDSKVQEARILFDNLPLDAGLLLDLHGDVSKEQVYAYEHKAENLPSITEKALMDNDTLLPYIKTKTIYQVKNTHGVCVDREETGFEEILEKLGTMYSITLEFPGKCSGQARTAGGVAIINSILKSFAKDPKKEVDNETKVQTETKGSQPGNSPQV